MITIKPGHVKTSATKNLSLTKFLTINSTTMGQIIFDAYKKKKYVVYTPYWRYIMALIRLLPEAIFKRLKI